ncbi:glucose-1-phosphate thymidylyltransferase [Comamonas humi]
MAPWDLIASLENVLLEQIALLSPEDYVVAGDIAIHKRAIVESSAVLKGPVVIGEAAFVAHGSYLRGGVWLGARCILGPSVEVKTSVILDGTKFAHFNFVGDSLVGSAVNLEAGSIICNYRNERSDGTVYVRVDERLQRIGGKFGALVGHGSKVGANAVIAPGAILPPGTLVPRASLMDQEQI